MLPSSEDCFRFAAPALVEVRVADLGTVSALRVTIPGMSVVLAQQVGVKNKCKYRVLEQQVQVVADKTEKTRS